MTPAERQAILLIRRRKNHEAARKYKDACERRDTRAMHKAHKEWVRAKAELIEAEAEL